MGLQVILNGRYIKSTDLENFFGFRNIITYSRLDGTETTRDGNRVQAAIDYAEDYVDDRLRNGPYVIPLPQAPSALKTIIDIVVRIAGVWLYQSRGVRDDDENDKMQAHRDRAEEMLNMILSGQMKLDAPRTGTQPTAMVIVV